MAKLLLPAIIGAVGLVLILLATIGGWVVVPNIIEDKIIEEVRLVEGSDTWKKWEKNPVPVFLKFYVFHVSNPDQVLAHTQIPRLEERGPYVYEEFRVKENIQIHAENDTISYTQPIKYIFRRDLSAGDQTDRVNVVNGALMSFAYALYGRLGRNTYTFVEALIETQSEQFLSLDVQVGDVLFSGYPISELYGQLMTAFGIEIPQEYADDRFGYYRKNNTNDGVYSIKAGIQNTTQFGKVVEWNGLTELNWWYPPKWLVPQNETNKPQTYCNQINGTDGTLFPPFVKKTTVLYNFITDVCRSANLVYKTDIEHLDIPGYKFGFSDLFYEDPAVNGDNYCFCTTPNYPDTGNPDHNLKSTCSKGVIRIAACKHDAPIVTSSPHFLHADEEFGTKVVGMNPDEIKHETFVQLEPNSGMMLKISKKVQINIEFQAIPYPPEFTYFEKFDHFLFPVFWADENVELDEHYADELKSKLITPKRIVEILKWTFLGIGCLLVGVTAALLIFRR